MIQNIYIAGNAASSVWTCVCFKAEGPCNIHQHGQRFVHIPLSTAFSVYICSLHVLRVRVFALYAPHAQVDSFFETCAFLDACIPPHWDIRGILNKSKSLYVTSVLRGIAAGTTPPGVCVCLSLIYGRVCVLVYTWGWRWEACIVSRCFGTPACLYISAAPPKALPRRCAEAFAGTL